jgi:hypothetical protein
MAQEPMRYFTIAEANELVPHLEEVFGRVLRLRAQLRTASQELEGLGERLTEESLRSASGPPELQRARGRALVLVEMLADEFRALEELGVQVKDPDTGLCDFVARHQGRDVFLCWRLGEKRVGFWHELNGGFAGRKPLDPSTERLPC